MTRRAPEELYLTEAQIAAKFGIALVDWQAKAAVLARSGLPPRDPVFENRRYWPAVRAFLDRRAGMTHDAPSLVPDGEENWDGNRGRKTRARA